MIWDPSTGRRFESSILGLGAEPEAGGFYQGYDGWLTGTWVGNEQVLWTLEERREIAAAMAERWTKWAELEPEGD